MRGWGLAFSLVVFLVPLPSTLLAQRDVQSLIGARIRVHPKATAGHVRLRTASVPVIGPLREAGPDYLLMQIGSSEASARFPMSAVARLDVSRGTSPRYRAAARGALRGLKLGLLIAPIASIAATRGGTHGSWEAVGIALGAGVLSGAVSGAIMPEEEWSTVWRR